MLCDGTGFGVCYCVGQARGVPSASRILHFFTLVWTSWAGWPHALTVDRGKEFMGEFATECSRHGVELVSVPLESPWLLGKAERRGGVFKGVWRRVVQDCQVDGLVDCQTTSTIVAQVLNDTENLDGFAPSQ